MVTYYKCLLSYDMDCAKHNAHLAYLAYNLSYLSHMSNLDIYISPRVSL